MPTETKRKQESQYSDKIDFQIKAVKRHKDGHYIMMKGSIQEEDITETTVSSIEDHQFQ